MIPTEPADEFGQLVVFAKDQPQYQQLPARVSNGVVTSRWQLSEDERRAILDGACVMLESWTFGRPLQPVRLWIEGVEQPVVVGKG